MWRQQQQQQYKHLRGYHYWHSTWATSRVRRTFFPSSVFLRCDHRLMDFDIGLCENSINQIKCSVAVHEVFNRSDLINLFLLLLYGLYFSSSISPLLRLFSHNVYYMLYYVGCIIMTYSRECDSPAWRCQSAINSTRGQLENIFPVPLCTWEFRLAR